MGGVEDCQRTQVESDDRSKTGGNPTATLVSQLLTAQFWASTGYLPGRSLPGRSVRRRCGSLDPFSASNTLHFRGGFACCSSHDTPHAGGLLQQEVALPSALEAGKRRSRRGECWVLLRPLSRVRRRPSPPVSARGGPCVCLCAILFL